MLWAALPTMCQEEQFPRGFDRLNPADIDHFCGFARLVLPVNQAQLPLIDEEGADIGVAATGHLLGNDQEVRLSVATCPDHIGFVHGGAAVEIERPCR